jgi:hypothetical protein
MPYYNCGICNYNTKLRTDYKRHLATKKHKSIVINPHDKIEKHKSTLINTSNPLNFHSTDPQFHSSDPPKVTKAICCKYCRTKYTRNDNLKRHLDKGCKEKNIINNENAKLNDIIELQKLKIKDLVKNCKTINSNNIQINNINMNIFGKENLSMVTDDVKKEMIKGPFKMMPKLLEMIYFNKNFPENHTMKMVNKNKDIMKIHDKDGWKLVDKADTIDYVLEDKNYEVDNFYDENSDEFSQFIKRTYKNFRRLFDNRDKDLWKQIKRDVDLLLWNNM